MAPSRPLLLGVVLLATILRVLFVGVRSLWLDEGVSIAMAWMNWGSFLRIVSQYEANMAVYYAFLRAWVHLGDSEGIVRGLSVIMSVVTVPLLFVLGRKMFGTRVGMLAALLLALNATHVAYAQEARSYSLVMLMVTVSSMCFLRYLEEPSPGRLAAYLLASVLAVYSHGYAAFVLMAHWAAAFSMPRKFAWKDLIGGALATGLLVVPLVVFFFTKDTGQYDWLTPPSPVSLAATVSLLAGGRWWLPVSVLLWVLAAARAVTVWTTSKGSREAWHYAFLAAWALAPALLSLGASVVKPIFFPRFLLVSLPALSILAAVGAAQLRPRLFLGTIAILIILAGFGIAREYRRPPSEDWRRATSFIASNVRPGDAVFLYAGTSRPVFDYYRRRFQSPRVDLPVLFPLAEYWPPQPAPGLERQALDLAMAQLPAGYRRVWLVLSHDQLSRLGRTAVSREIQRDLASRYPVMREREFHNIRVLLYQ